MWFWCEFPAGQFCPHISSTEFVYLIVITRRVSALEDRIEMWMSEQRYLCIELCVTGLGIIKRRKREAVSVTDVTEKIAKSSAGWLAPWCTVWNAIWSRLSRKSVSNRRELYEILALMKPYISYIQEEILPRVPVIGWMVLAFTTLQTLETA